MIGRSAAALATELSSGGLALLNTQSGKYFTTNEIGRAIWNEIETPKAVNDLVHFLVRRYSIDIARSRSDVDAFLGAMLIQQLVTHAKAS